MALSIRRGRPGDRSAIARLIQELGYPVEPRFTDETIAQVIAHPETAVFVATDGRELHGYIALSLRPQMRLGGLLACIDELVVAAAQRDKGVGTMLLDAGVAHAKSLRCRRIEVQTSRVRESYQRRFYVKHGFEEVDTAVLRVKP